MKGEVLGVLCCESGTTVYEKCSSELLKSVEENLERHIPGDDGSEGQHTTDEAVPVDVSSSTHTVILIFQWFYHKVMSGAIHLEGRG